MPAKISSNITPKVLFILSKLFIGKGLTMSKNLKKSNEITHMKNCGGLVCSKNNKGDKAIDCPITSSITISFLSFSNNL